MEMDITSESTTLISRTDLSRGGCKLLAAGRERQAGHGGGVGIDPDDMALGVTP